MKLSLSLLICLIFFKLNSLEHLNCLILLNEKDSEHVALTFRFYLMNRLQSAIAEKSTPILVHQSLWNAFLERRENFAQESKKNDTKQQKNLALYNKIQEKIQYWSKYYNSISNDITQNKNLVIQRINEEFYTTNEKLNVSDLEYQLLLNYLTPFNPEDWSIYKKSGFYLLIPKDYIAQHSTTGFKLDNLEEVTQALDIGYNYFESQNPSPLVDLLSDFFITYDDVPNKTLSYIWNIIISGHGCNETWNGKTIMLVDLTPQEFHKILNFFQTKVQTHIFHYGGCSSGGTNIKLAFDDPTKVYNFGIICDCLTDCDSYCKWNNVMPSDLTKFLTTNDLSYDSAKNSWDLIIKSPYEWGKFFKSISKIDFSIKSLEHLPKVLSYITYTTYPIIANTSLLRRPGINNFFPVYPSNMTKIDDLFLKTEKQDQQNNSIVLNNTEAILLESEYIDSNLKIDNSTLSDTEKLRIISIKPGEAVHYIKKLNMVNHVDLPSVFWQAEFQKYNKIFLVDECAFPYSVNSRIFNEIPENGKEIILKKALIILQSNLFTQLLRIFFTINDKTMMIVANKPSYQLDEKATIHEIITLSPEAKQKYKECYMSYKKSLDSQARTKN